MAEYTANLNLEKQQGNEYINIDGLNDNFDKIDMVLGNTAKFETAGGTATAITLTGIILENGDSKTFIVSANNNAAATTINTKPLYKPGTTSAPNLIAGKAVTVWYNIAGGCFFIKASAEGDAIAENVLATKKFSNDKDTNIPGTMPNFSNQTKQIVNHGHAMSVYVDTADSRMGMIEMPNGLMGAGYVDTNTRFKAQLWGLLPENIKVGAYIGQYSGYGTGFMAGTFTADATAIAAHMLAGVTAYVNGIKVTGTMPARGSEEYAGWRRAEVYNAPMIGRIHLRIPLGAYLTGTEQQQGQLGIFCDDAEFNPAYFLATVNVFGMQGGIPVTMSDLGDSVPAIGTTVYSGYDGNNYAMLQIKPNAYIGNANWVRSYQPDLLPANIVKDKNIMGTVGTALVGRRYASGSGNAVSNEYNSVPFYDEDGDYYTASGVVFAHVPNLPFTPNVVKVSYDNAIVTYIAGSKFIFSHVPSSVAAYRIIPPSTFPPLGIISTNAFQLPLLRYSSTPTVFSWEAWE